MSTDQTQQTQCDSDRGNTISRSRAWVFTINNPKDHGLDSADSLDSLLSGEHEMIVQLEKGEEGTVHYQGTVRFKNQRTFDQVRKMCGVAH